jgi:type II secretion system protein G
MKSSQKGFTLIELLVVIAIIGILASVILASLNSARAKGRDSYRIQSIKQLQTALEIYYNDYNAYPTTSSAWYGNCATFGSYPTTGATGYIPNLAPKYISELPIDPGQTTGACFLYRSNGTDYYLMAYKTFEGTAPAANIRQAAPTEKDYAIFTPGAALW